MSLTFKLAWGVLIIGGFAALTIAGRAYSSAAATARQELSSARTLVVQVRELERLKPRSHEWSSRKRPESGLAARLGEALASAGLPSSTLVNVTPQPESLAGTPGSGAASVRRQRASLTLAPITLPQFGAFLDAWRHREPYWTVASIDLSQDNAQKLPPALEGGGDLMLRVVITLDAVYLDQKGDGE